MTAVTAPTREASRPTVHYATKNTWLNDPNGLIYYEGSYHLYYQNNPFGNVWGNMSWGHATSTNLITWTEQPVAIACDENEDIYSGSVVYDSTTPADSATELLHPWSPSTQAPTRRTHSTPGSRPSHWPGAPTAATPGPNTTATPS